MTRRTYTPEYKAKLVIEVLKGEKELNTIAAENGISPNMLRNWKAEFMENASRAFDGSRQAKDKPPLKGLPRVGNAVGRIVQGSLRDVVRITPF